MVTIANKATLEAMMWVERNVNGTGVLAMGVETGSINQTRIDNLHWLMAHLRNNTAPIVDKAALEAAMAKSQGTAKPSTSKPDQEEDREHSNELAGLSLLAVPIGVAPLMFRSVCTDPVLCSSGNLDYLSQLLEGARTAAAQPNLLQPLMDRQPSPDVGTPEDIAEGQAEESEFQQWLRGQREQLLDEDGDFILNGNPNEGSQADQADWEDFTGPSDELDPGETFRAERFNPESQTLEQQTLRYIGHEVDTGPHLQGVNPARMVENGYRGFHILDANGEPTITTKGVKTERVVWHRPQDLHPVDGGWEQLGEQSVLVQDDAPVMNSQGEPIVQIPSTSAGTTPALGSLQAASASSIRPGKGVKFGEKYAFRLINADSTVVKGSDGSDALVLYNPNEAFRLWRDDLQEITEAKLAKAPEDDLEPPPEIATPTPASPTAEGPQSTERMQSATSQPASTTADTSPTSRLASTTAESSHGQSTQRSMSTLQPTTFETVTRSHMAAVTAELATQSTSSKATTTMGGCSAPERVAVTTGAGGSGAWQDTYTISWAPCQ